MKFGFTLLKGRELPPGTERVWGGKTYKKVAPKKWKLVKKGPAKIEKKGNEKDIKKKLDIKDMNLSNITTEYINTLKKDPEVRNKFIAKNQAFVRYTMNRMLSKIKNISDSMQDANIGFIKAIDNFNVKKSPKAFLKYVRDYLTGYAMHDIKREWKKTELNISLEGKVVGTEDITLEETISDPKVKEVEEKRTREEGVELLLENLPKRQGKIIQLMIEGKTKRSIAKEMGMTKQQVGRIVRKKIKPIAEKYLIKSDFWEEFLEILDEY